MQPDTDVIEPRPSQPADLPPPGRRKRWVLVAMAMVALSFVVLTADWFLETSFFLDDYVLCDADASVGDSMELYWDLTGVYRPVTYPVVAFRKLTCDVFWIHKVIGLALHLMVGAMLFAFVMRLGIGRLGGITAAAVWIFNPLAFEATAWPAPVYGYPLAALIVMWLAYELVAPRPRIRLAALLALGAVMVNEVTLGLIVLLPLVLTAGPVLPRLRRSWSVLWPTALYLVTLTAFVRVIPNVRSSTIGAAGLANLFTELGWLRHGFIPLAPFGSLWREFAAGTVDWRYFVAILLFAGGLLITLASRRQLESAPSPVRLLAVAGGGLALAVATMAPFVAQGVAFTSPRYVYVAYAPLAVTAAAVGGAFVGRRNLIMWVGAILPLVWVMVVADGLVAEGEAYDAAFHHDRATAEALAAAAVAASPKQIVLVDSPWTTVDAPLVGHHIVHPFVVPWAAPYALQLLGGYTADTPMAVNNGPFLQPPPEFMCWSDGALRINGVVVQSLEDVLVFDVGNRSPVKGLELPDGSYQPLAAGGLDLPVAECLP